MKYTSSLTGNTNFRRMYYQGKFKAGKFVVVYLKRGKKGKTRLGITTSKKVGNAVRRNRCRRMILAAYRKLEDRLNLRGFDVVIVARAGMDKKKSTDIERELLRLVPLLKKNF